MSGLRTALLHYSASSGLSLLVRLAVGLLLARWLSPEDFGTWGLALAIYGGCQLLRDLGVSAWVQRVPALDAQDWSAALGLSLAAALACALGLWALAAPLEALLGHAGLAAPLRLLALALPLSALGSLLAALQMRRLAARPLAWVARAGDLAFAAVALGLCVNGWGATGLAVAELGCGLACTALSWRLREPGLRWRPGLRGWGRLLRFGLPLQGAQALAWATAAWPAAWLGLRLPGGELGHFLRAQATVQLLPQLAQPALGFAALPWLSRAQAEGRPLAPALEHLAALLTGLGWPALALLVWAGPELLVLLYGPGWAGCAPGLLPLALAVALGLAWLPQAAALTARGLTRRVWQLQLVQLLLRLLASLSGAVLWPGSGWLGLAWAWALAALLAWPLQAVVAWRDLGQRPGTWALHALAASAAALAVAEVLGAVAGLAAALALLCASGHPLRGELAAQLPRRLSTTRK